MSGTLDFAGMVPGFDFLQNLMKGAGAAMPTMGQWVAPTLDPEELDKRIKELRTVQFWLEQNARLLATTIQALEVQRMTLATLKTMNMPMSDLRDALAIKTPVAAPPPSPPVSAWGAPAPSIPPEAASAPAAATPPAVDPVQWWGALTQQFSQIAAQALQTGAAEAAKLQPVAAAAGLADSVSAPGKTAAKKLKPARSPAGKPATTGAKRSR